MVEESHLPLYTASHSEAVLVFSTPDNEEPSVSSGDELSVHLHGTLIRGKWSREDRSDHDGVLDEASDDGGFLAYVITEVQYGKHVLESPGQLVYFFSGRHQ